MLKFDLIIRTLRKNKIAFLIIASLIVAIITYLLVMPAFTLEKEEAEKKGGIEVSDASSELTYTSDDYKVRCTLSGSEDFDAASEADEKDPDVKESSKDEEKKDKDGKDADAAGGSVDLDVKELTKKDDGYSSYVKRAEQAVAKELSKEDSNMKIKGSSVYDISLIKDGEETEPEDPVKVTFEYDKIKKMSEADDVRIVHFAVIDGKEKIEVLAPGDVNVSEKNGSIRSIDFRADSFSVYAIVYTVDFHYEADGETYDFSLEGNDAISLRDLVKKLHITKDIDTFMDQIDTVEFTDPELLKVCKVDTDMTLWDLKMKYRFLQEIDYWKEEAYLHKFNEVDHKFKAGDYALVSIRPFDTKEALTIKLKNGESYVIDVTDAQDATMNDDGTVATITNPSGTTFELFDYWVNDDLHARESLDPSDPNYIYSRLSWPGFKSAGTDGEGLKWDQPLRGTGGNNAGINSSTSDTQHGHAFKFSPAYSHTIYDGTINNWRQETSDGWTQSGTDWSQVTTGVNSYTMNADPRQGIIEGQLVNGYPKLTNNSSLGTNGESLSYLFDPNVSHAGKASYTGADKLLYVDKDGYYTYDSRDYAASYDKDSKEFTLREQTSDDGEVRGFWPFGQQQFWMGMHMNTQFSMPTNGQVLNPKKEMKDMQFEFSGDDDTWLFIDGVLVGDGGGVHNRTEIDINFAEGKAIVRGDRDPKHQDRAPGVQPFYQEQYLDDIFKAAGKYNDDEWEPIPGSTHKRFKEGTYHTFDMFYIERGGGESNLYIHYNLVSTADFTAHKTYEGAHGDDTIRRNQFEFELIGLDGRYNTNGTLVDADKKAIMPNNADESGEGTVESPYFNRNTTTTLIVDGVETDYPSQTYRTGVTEDGNVNFGTAVISEEDKALYNSGHTPVYRYVVREYVPDNAINADGIKWKDATEAQKEAGGFVYRQTEYDGAVHYMTAAVTRWQVKDSDGNPKTDSSGNPVYQYGLSKRYYTDSTFTELEPDDKRFINFANKYVADYGDVDFMKVKADRTSLAGAVFTLYTDARCTKEAKDDDNNTIRATSNGDGKVEFKHIPVTTYYMKETQAPSGYALDDTIYKVEVASSKDTTEKSVISVASDRTNTPVTEVTNLKPGELSVQKKWVDQEGKETDGSGRAVTVKLKRKHYVEVPGPEHNVRVQMSVFNGNWHSGPENTFSVNGDTVVIEYNDQGKGNFNWELTVGNKRYDGWVSHGNEVDSRDCYTIRQYGERRRVTITDVTGDVSYSVRHWDDELFRDKGYWARLNDPTVTATRSKAIYGLEDDTAFNNQNHTQTLDESNNYAHTWKIGNSSGNDFPASNDNGKYLYYLAELKADGTEVALNGEVSDGVTLKSIKYDPALTDEEPGLQQGLITVTNEVTAPPTVDITLEKYDINDLDKQSASKLGGATFKLEKYTDATFRETDTTWPAQTKADTAGTGTFSFTEVREGFYKLIETNCPDGYIKTGDDPRIRISVSHGQAVITLLDNSGHEISGNQSDSIRIANSTIKYGNTPGAELPMSGGCGTHLIYLLGAVLAIGCAGMLIARKRCE